MVEPRDGFVLAHPELAVGGMRMTPDSPVLRVDATAHGLHALCTALTAARQVRALS